MKQFLLLLLLVSYNLLLAQTYSLDLFHKIDAADTDDNSELVLKLSKQFLSKEAPDSTLTEVLHYQAVHAKELEQFDLSEQSYIRLLDLLKTTEGEHSDNYLNTCNNYAFMLRLANKNETAVQFYEKALALSLKHKHYKQYVETALNFGGHYEILGVMELAIKYYKLSLKHMSEAGEKHSRTHISALHNLARSYEIQHRYDEAESLYKEALVMAENTLDEVDEFRFFLTNDFGMLYFFTRQYKKATPYFEQLKKIIDEGRFPLEDATIIFTNLADCYAHLGRYDEAEALYKKAIKIESNEEHLYIEYYPVTVSRVGDLYYYQGRLAEAKQKHLEAVALAKEHFSEHDLYLFYNMEQAYLFFENTKDWEAVRNIAIECFERNCMDKLPESGVLDNIQALAEKQTFATMPYALKSLRVASHGYWEGYLATQDISYLKHAYQIQLAIRILLHRVKNSFATELDKLELLSTTHQISELGIKISQELFKKTGDPQYQESSFIFMENNKYVLLQDALQVREAQVFGDVPKEIIEKETYLDQALLMAKTRKIQAYEEKDKATAIQEYNQVLHDIDQFKQDLEIEHPSYYQYKYATENPSIASIQANLTSEKALVEYFIGTEQVHVHIFEADKTHYLSLDIETSLIQSKVEAFRKELTNYVHISSNGKLAQKAYEDLAFWFYQNLLEPALSKIPQVKELVIIPDGLLGHLPFEAFLMSSPKQGTALKDLDFLVRKYKISYAYSANLLLQKASKSNSNQGILAMGATYNIDKKSNYKFPKSRSSAAKSLRKSLKPLQAIEPELAVLKSIFEGDYYFGNDANEKTFKENASNYAILHLAMHGILNEKQPILSSLAFTENGDENEDNFLQAFEISQLKLNAQLVVLSACETGYGKFQQGEGVMSLARSFMYAGVPAMIVSMWQVNDASTALIMQNFYQNLSKEMDKAEALRLAKLDYIQAAQGLAAHPAFWAPFIQLGDTQAVQLNTKTAIQPWLIGGGIVGLLMFGLMFFRKRKES